MQVSTLIRCLRSRHTILIQEEVPGPEGQPSHVATTVPATQLEDLFQTPMLVGLAGPGEELRLGLAQVSPVHEGEQSSTFPRTRCPQRREGRVGTQVLWETRVENKPSQCFKSHYTK